MSTFDKTKPYGLIGGTFGVARFEQDGKYYDNQGTLLDGEGNPLKSKGKKTDETPVGATNDNQVPGGQLVSDQAGGEDEKAKLVERAKALKIKSPHLSSVDNLKAKIAKAEGELSPEAQLEANLGGE